MGMPQIAAVTARCCRVCWWRASGLEVCATADVVATAAASPSIQSHILRELMVLNSSVAGLIPPLQACRQMLPGITRAAESTMRPLVIFLPALFANYQ